MQEEEEEERWVVGEREGRWVRDGEREGGGCGERERGVVGEREREKIGEKKSKGYMVDFTPSALLPCRFTHFQILVTPSRGIPLGTPQNHRHLGERGDGAHNITM